MQNRARISASETVRGERALGGRGCSAPSRGWPRTGPPRFAPRAAPVARLARWAEGPLTWQVFLGPSTSGAVRGQDPPWRSLNCVPGLSANLVVRGYHARMNTRRQFLITAAMGTVSVAACQRQQQATGQRPAADARGTARVRDRARRRTRDITVHLRRGREARAGDDDRRRTSDSRRKLAPDDGAARRAACRAAEGGARSGRRASDALGSAHHGHEHRASGRPVRAKSGRQDSSAVERRRYRVRTRNDAVALD